MSEKDNIRVQRHSINKPCILHPWKVPAKLLNMSTSGAFIYCLDITEELLTSTEGVLEVGKFRLPGNLIRLEQYKIGIEFSDMSAELISEIESFLSQYPLIKD